MEEGGVGHFQHGNGYWFELCVDADARLGGAISAPSYVSFDILHEAVVVGWHDGMVSTYDINSLNMPFSSFKAQPGPIRQLISMGTAGIVSLSDQHVAIHAFGGAPYISCSLLEDKDDKSKRLTNALLLDHSRFVVSCSSSSNGSSLYEMDLTRLETTSKRFLHKFGGAVYNHGVQLMCPTAFGTLVCANTDGKLGLVDLRVGHMTCMPMIAHSGSICDLDVYERTVVTCGKASDGRPDPFVKIFDIRMTTRPIGVLQVQASFVRFIPGRENYAVFSGEMGNIQAISGVNLGTDASVEQIDQIQSGGGVITSMAASMAGHALGFTDSAGFVHLWTDDEEWVDTPKPNINPYSEPFEELPPTSFQGSDKTMGRIEFWDENQSDLVNQAAFLNFDLEEISLASDLNEFVLSKPVHSKAIREIRPALLEKAQTRRDFPGQYIETSPEDYVMNQALIFGQETSKSAYITSNDAPSSTDNNAGEEDNKPLHPSDREGFKKTMEKNKERLLAEIPEPFQKPKLVLSNIGLADFDYGKYNQTPFSGLEGTLPNSYANQVLQVLYFQPEVREMLLGSVSKDPSCLATEAGFLFHMLDQAQGAKSMVKICEARNLLRTFRLSSDAQALRLLEPTNLEIDQRASAFLRFLFEQFGRSHQAFKTRLAKLFGITKDHKDHWLRHNLADQHRNSVSLMLDIAYPHELSKAVVSNTEVPNLSFLELLRLSFVQSKRTKLWSKEHSEQLPVEQTTTVTSLSQCLVINAASHDNRSIYLPLYRQKNKDADQSKPFVADRFKVSYKKNGSVAVEEADAEEFSTSKTLVYELCAVVSHIYPSEHLVAHIRIPHDYAERANHSRDGKNQPLHPQLRRRGSSAFRGGAVENDDWILFNDFRVVKVEKGQEGSILDFKSPWRNPVMFVYRQSWAPGQSEAETGQDEDNTDPLTLSEKEIFFAPSLAHNPPRTKSFTALELDKLPGKGDLVAIDCEMVALTTEESYVNHDGRRVVTQQPQLSLARVSCLTGNETVFIDDYIVTPDPIVDYLTRFSGLVPGDLDPRTSKHHLVPLRIAYLKLQHLVSRGVIFVGHGLRKDFRVANIYVPEHQILDSLHLFHLPDRRFLSLSFLASYLLQEEIQDSTHDSIEDARTALRVFRKYEEFKEQGILDNKLNEIYQEGFKRNFQ